MYGNRSAGDQKGVLLRSADNKRVIVVLRDTIEKEDKSFPQFIVYGKQLFQFDDGMEHCGERYNEVTDMKAVPEFVLGAEAETLDSEQLKQRLEEDARTGLALSSNGALAKAALEYIVLLERKLQKARKLILLGVQTTDGL